MFEEYDYCDAYDRYLFKKGCKRVIKTLIISSFVGGLLTAIVTYTCTFFGINLDDAKNDVVEVQDKGVNENET